MHAASLTTTIIILENMTTLGAKEEQLMTSYLLGAATEEECVAVEEHFLRDPEYLNQLRALEYEMIDDYVRGEMPSAERQSFERRLLASPQGLEQVASARRLHSQLDQIAWEEREPEPLTAGARKGLWERLRTRFFTPMPVWRYGLTAAALLLLAGGLWLLRESNLARLQIASLTAERESLRQREKNLQEQLASQHVEERQTASQLENEKRQLAAERSRNAQLQEETRRLLARSSSAPLAEGSFVELALASGIERNSGEPRRLNIPAGVRLVKLQLELDPSISHRTYRAELNTAGGTQVWNQGGLVAQRADLGRFVTLLIPARALHPGEYELTLRGLSDERKREVAGYYYFIASPSPARR